MIIGGGFGGLYAAIALRKANVGITLIDRRNFHLFQPLLYQVATGGLSPANIATPLRSILSRQKNCEVVLGEVSTIDVAAKMVIVGHNAFEYDSLVVAAGASHAYFGHDEWEPLAPGLKTIEDATNIRCRILAAFEAAEIEADPIKRAAWMTFLVVGGGPTGVELTGALSELAHHTLKHDYRNINPSDAKIILVNASDRVLMPYPEDLSAAAMESLESRNVEVMLDTKLTGVYPDFVVVETPQGVRQIPTKTTLWAAGVKASALGQQLAAASGEPADRTGRVIVQPICLWLFSRKSLSSATWQVQAIRQASRCPELPQWRCNREIMWPMLFVVVLQGSLQLPFTIVTMVRWRRSVEVLRWRCLANAGSLEFSPG